MFSVITTIYRSNLKPEINDCPSKIFLDLFLKNSILRKSCNFFLQPMKPWQSKWYHYKLYPSKKSEKIIDHVNKYFIKLDNEEKVELPNFIFLILWLVPPVFCLKVQFFKEQLYDLCDTQNLLVGSMIIVVYPNQTLRTIKKDVILLHEKSNSLGSRLKYYLTYVFWLITSPIGI